MTLDSYLKVECHLWVIMPLTIGVCTTEVGCVIIELMWSCSGESGEFRGLGNCSIPVLEVK